MKALTVYGPYDASYGETPIPKAEGRFMTVKVERAGLCATDISIWTGNSSFITDGLIKYPCRFGHEWAGTVVAVGDDVKGFKVGDRVYSDSGISCGECADCQAGRYHKCQYTRSVGTVNCWDGCFAEYMSIPDYNAYHVPDAISFDEAALIEPLSISLDAFHNVKVGEDTTAVVIGSGAIGLGAVWVAKYLGVGRVVFIGRSPRKMEVAKQLGADILINSNEVDPVEEVRKMTGGAGAELVVETSGAYSALLQALYMTAKDGRVSILSFYEKNLDNFPMDYLALNQISVVGGAGRYGNPQQIAEIMATYSVKATPIISHHIAFEDMHQFLKDLDQYKKTKIKVMIEFK
ncbi:MAG: hypothetical protein E7618_00690 [Ruminococcaceae bacterium]|nr:hypothetical protein [Oscillospiraceae bacterium]